jgi:hypothetical protein
MSRPSNHRALLIVSRKRTGQRRGLPGSSPVSLQARTPSNHANHSGTSSREQEMKDLGPRDLMGLEACRRAARPWAKRACQQGTAADPSGSNYRGDAPLARRLPASHRPQARPMPVPWRRGPDEHLTTRQYARLVSEWISGIALDPLKYATHSMPRTKATLTYWRTGKLRAVQLLLGHHRIEPQCAISESRSTTRLRLPRKPTCERSRRNSRPPPDAPRACARANVLPFLKCHGVAWTARSCHHWCRS